MRSMPAFQAFLRRAETPLTDTVPGCAMDEGASISHPRANLDLVGQGAAQNVLRAACLGGRMAHGWLFAGPSGIGKATLAYHLAKFLFAGPAHQAAGSHGLDVPGEIPAARLVASGTHPDLHVLSANPDDTRQNEKKTPSVRGEIKIDQVRALSRVLAQTTGAGGARVCIVDAADDLNRNAANALLKSLEEPPTNTYFVLIAHRPAQVLPTLRSRCQRLDLAPLDQGTVAALLCATLGEDAKGERQTIVSLANGSIGDALRLAQEGGLEMAHEIVALAQSLPRLDGRDLHKLAARLAPAKADPQFRLFAELLLGWIADLVRVSATGEGSRFGPQGAALAARLVDRNRLEPWAALWENLREALSQTLALNLDRKQFLLNAFFALEATQRASKQL
ncbi:MAG: DNA polymerase III subunit delta' [Alphaproteobacteria bacterium]